MQQNLANTLTARTNSLAAANCHPPDPLSEPPPPMPHLIGSMATKDNKPFIKHIKLFGNMADKPQKETQLIPHRRQACWPS